MSRRTTSIATPVAHLVGPGKLKVINGRLAFAAGQETPVRLDPAALRTVLCYGKVGVTDEAVALLFKHGVQVAWLTPAGNRCQGRLERSDPSTTLLRIHQHQVLQRPEWKRALAAGLVAAKLESQIAAARHYQRHGCRAAGGVVSQLRAALRQCQEAANLDVLRGVEGAASARWFELLGRLLVAPWVFPQRLRRPPPDPVNALLSLGYSILTRRAEARATAAGLEVALGALHEFRPGRPSLACDLVEPLRVPAVDRWVIQVCNEHQVMPDDFLPEGGGMRLRPEVFGRIVHSWEKHWEEGSQQQALDQVLEQLVTAIRRYGAELPTPVSESAESGGLGDAASDWTEGG